MKPTNPVYQSDFRLNSYPEILLWHPDINLQYLNLSNQEAHTQHDYDVAPKEEGVLQIVPRTALPNGPYCIVQGNPLASYYSLHHWCFKVITTAANDTDGSDNDGASSESRDQLAEGDTLEEIILGKWTSDSDGNLYEYFSDGLVVWQVGEDPSNVSSAEYRFSGEEAVVTVLGDGQVIRTVVTVVNRDTLIFDHDNGFSERLERVVE